MLCLTTVEHMGVLRALTWPWFVRKLAQAINSCLSINVSVPHSLPLRVHSALLSLLCTCWCAAICYSCYERSVHGRPTHQNTSPRSKQVPAKHARSASLNIRPDKCIPVSVTVPMSICIRYLNCMPNWQALICAGLADTETDARGFTTSRLSVRRSCCKTCIKIRLPACRRGRMASRRKWTRIRARSISK